MSLDISTIYAEQVSLNSLVQNVLYASGTVGAILVVVGLLLIDAGTAAEKTFSTLQSKKHSVSFSALQPIISSGSEFGQPSITSWSMRQ